MRILSTAFTDGAAIPPAYSCDGAGTNPPLQFSDVPPGTRSLALISHDPDVPKDRRPDGIFNHWVVFNMDPGLTGIREGEIPAGVTGRTTAGTNGWVPMAPPTGSGTHRYYFTLYALDCRLGLGATCTKADLIGAMDGHILAAAQLMGTFRRD